MYFHKIENGVRIGRWNHDKGAEYVNWPSVLEKAIRFAKTASHRVYIKNKLAEVGDVPPEFREMIFG